MQGIPPYPVQQNRNYLLHTKMGLPHHKVGSPIV